MTVLLLSRGGWYAVSTPGPAGRLHVVRDTFVVYTRTRAHPSRDRADVQPASRGRPPGPGDAVRRGAGGGAAGGHHDGDVLRHRGPGAGARRCVTATSDRRHRRGLAPQGPVR